MNLEWMIEKLFQFSPLLGAGALTLYTSWRNRKDKKESEEKDDKKELTTEILADGSSIRKEQSERLKAEQARYDRVVVVVENLRKDIVDLKGSIVDFRGEVKELKFINMTLTREKQEVEEENDKLRAEKVLLQNEIKDLRARVGDLEMQVKTLIEREKSG